MSPRIPLVTPSALPLIPAAPIHSAPANIPPPSGATLDPPVRLRHFHQSVHPAGRGAVEREQVGGHECERGACGGDEEEEGGQRTGLVRLNDVPQAKDEDLCNSWMVVRVHQLCCDSVQKGKIYM